MDSNPYSTGGHLRLGISSMWQILLGEELHESDPSGSSQITALSGMSTFLCVLIIPIVK